MHNGASDINISRMDYRNVNAEPKQVGGPMEYTPQTFKEYEAYNYGYGKGIVDTLLDLYDAYPEISNSDIWKEYIVMAGVEIV